MGNTTPSLARQRHQCRVAFDSREQELPHWVRFRLQTSRSVCPRCLVLQREVEAPAETFLGIQFRKTPQYPKKPSDRVHGNWEVEAPVESYTKKTPALANFQTTHLPLFHNGKLMGGNKTSQILNYFFLGKRIAKFRVPVLINPSRKWVLRNVLECFFAATLEENTTARFSQCH